MSKIKVLFALPNLQTAGSGREMISIAERLDKNVFEAWIGIQQPGGKLFDEVIAKRLPIVVQPFLVEETKSAIQKFIEARNYAKDFKPMQFDIWQSFNWSSDFSEALVARASGAKYVYVKKNMNWERKAWKVKSRLSTAIVARNTTMQETILGSKQLKKKVHLIHGGVDTDMFRPSFNLQIRNELGIPERAKVACCVAQIVRSKDQATLIKAIARVEQYYLILAGAVRDEQYKSELDELIKKLNVGDRVKFAGAVDNVNNLLNACNTFVLPTSLYKGHEEGCPVAVLEAMAAGTPCIVSDVAGSRDLVQHGKTGLVFKPENVDALADCLRDFVTKPSYPKELAERALDKVYSSYSRDREVHRFEEMYKQIVKRG